MKLDARGKLSSGDADIPASHHGFGADVLAVADGTIVAVRDDVPDPAAVKGRTNPGIADASGNYVMLDIGGGRIATYEHLKQGAPVAVGDRVKAGQEIGRAHVRTPITNAHIVCRLQLAKTQQNNDTR